MFLIDWFDWGCCLGPRNVWEPRCCSEIYKYTKMRHFNKSKIFSNVEGPRENVSPGPAVALNVRACHQWAMSNKVWSQCRRFEKF